MNSSSLSPSHLHPLTRNWQLSGAVESSNTAACCWLIKQEQQRDVSNINRTSINNKRLPVSAAAAAASPFLSSNTFPFPLPYSPSSHFSKRLRRKKLVTHKHLLRSHKYFIYSDTRSADTWWTVRRTEQWHWQQHFAWCRCGL